MLRLVALVLLEVLVLVELSPYVLGHPILQLVLQFAVHVPLEVLVPVGF
jgi:hypothetical protein